MSLTEKLLEYLKTLSPEELSRAVAFVLAPGVALLAVGASTEGLAGAFRAKPLTYFELRVQGGQSETMSRAGALLIVEPSEFDYRVPIDQGEGAVWSSLTEEDLAVNKDRLFVEDGTLTGRAPLFGVSEPVAVVVEGQPKGELLLPGRADDLHRWRPSSRRSTTIVTSALLSCVFGLGAAMALSLQSSESDVDARREH